MASAPHSHARKKHALNVRDRKFRNRKVKAYFDNSDPEHLTIYIKVELDEQYICSYGFNTRKYFIEVLSDRELEAVWSLMSTHESYTLEEHRLLKQLQRFMRFKRKLTAKMPLKTSVVQTLELTDPEPA